jgi:hypothetical protein
MTIALYDHGANDRLTALAVQNQSEPEDSGMIWIAGPTFFLDAARRFANTRAILG